MSKFDKFVIPKRVICIHSPACIAGEGGSAAMLYATTFTKDAESAARESHAVNEAAAYMT
jgi:hypothetical protein